MIHNLKVSSPAFTWFCQNLESLTRIFVNNWLCLLFSFSVNAALASNYRLVCAHCVHSLVMFSNWSERLQTWKYWHGLELRDGGTFWNLSAAQTVKTTFHWAQITGVDSTHHHTVCIHNDILSTVVQASLRASAVLFIYLVLKVQFVGEPFLHRWSGGTIL